MKIAIAHKDRDSADMLRRVVVAVRKTSVAWIANEAEQAIRSCKSDRPDLLLLGDLGKADGIATTRRIMVESPCAIVIVAPSISASVSKVYDAMSAGAVDAVDMPTLFADGRIQGTDKLLDKISLVRKLVGEVSSSSERSIRSTSRERLPPLIALGASTGGPQALATVVGAFPKDLDAAVIIVQHFDQLYAQGFVDWLGSRCKMPVQLVTEGKGPKRGTVLVGATNDHLIMDDTRALSYTAHPRAKAYRPSVDVFFESLLKYWPRNAVAALLTGMGGDGAEGLLHLREKGWFTVAQDEATRVVFGMPKAAAELKAAGRVLPITEIGPAILGSLKKLRPV